MGDDNELRVLVTGATGQQGGAVADALVDAGHAVRALTRIVGSPVARRLARGGIEVVGGSFDDRASLTRAVQGVDAIFAMSTPFQRGPDVEVRHARALIETAAAAHVRHVVYSSTASALEDTGVPYFDSKASVERVLEEACLPFTIVAPVFFMENLRSSRVLPRLRFGKLAMPLPRHRLLQMVALDDLAELVVHVMEERGGFVGERVEVASDALPGWRIAEIIAEIMGRRVDYVEAPAPTSLSRSPDFLRTFEWLARVGHSVDIPALHRRFPSIGWRSFEEWARARSWRRALRDVPQVLDLSVPFGAPSTVLVSRR